ncbi:MAG: DUF1887 family protein [Prevotella sp.]|nr:DUF1887 family protein [Prevotella sp.]
MESIHIALVGGQPVPVNIGIRDDGNAQNIVLICSPESSEVAGRIKNEFPDRTFRIEKCDSVNLTEIEELSEKLKAEFSDYEVTLNLTSGTKLWCLYFFNAFRDVPLARFIYVDQTNKIIDVLTKDVHIGDIDYLTRFKQHGTPLTSFTSYEDYTEKDFIVMNEVEKFRDWNRQDFALLTGNVNRNLLHNYEPIRPIDSGSKVEYDRETITITLVDKKGKEHLATFKSPHVFDLVFNFGWFELKVAKELTKFGSNVVKDIKLNCEFSYTSGNTKNEIDIIADFGYRLVFVECKTMIHDITDLDKFGSALRIFSGTSTIGVFATNDDPHRAHGNFSSAKEKCKDNGILFFNFTRWKESGYAQNGSLKKLIEAKLHNQNIR